jgi:hypothetical protein
MGLDEEEIYSKWKYINEIYDGMLSICTSRGKLSDEGLVARVKEMIKGRKPYSTIIQADGFPMSGGEDTYKSTLQAVRRRKLFRMKSCLCILCCLGVRILKRQNWQKCVR